MTFIALLIIIWVVGQREAGGLGITDILMVVLVAGGRRSRFHCDASSVTDGLLLVADPVTRSVRPLVVRGSNQAVLAGEGAAARGSMRSEMPAPAPSRRPSVRDATCRSAAPYEKA